MTGDYRFVVDADVLEFFTKRSKRGREHQLNRFGRWLVTFWPDPPVCELRISDVRKLTL
jgi:hypothetical protein